MLDATAFVIEGPGAASLRPIRIDPPGDGEVLVRTRVTGVSRGTESTVFTGRVPASERERMRAPFQEGEFPGPVTYGYLNVGTVEEGDADLVGRTVFTLFPHQSRFTVPSAAVVPVPDGVPPRRAVLAGIVETAVNVLWDAGPLLGDRLTIIGAGTVGCCIARLAAGIPGSMVTLVDIDPDRRDLDERLGVAFAGPSGAPPERDTVIDASGSEDGLRLALETVADDGEIIEASWFGDRSVTLPLGADFHARRLTIRSSQVGAVSVRRRGCRTTRDRLALALELLRDPVFDALLTGPSSWRDLPTVMAELADGQGTGGCRTIDWGDC